MGKAAKAHRAKVLKRNRDRQHVENKMKKEWNAAFEEQMTKMKEQFATMSGMTESMSELTTETEETVLNEVSEDTTEPTGSVQGV
jgi:hypothetical protein